MMIYGWIRDHKKLAIIIAAGSFVAIALIVILLVTLLNPSGSSEEPEATAKVSVSNLSILYDNFSDYTIGYVLNAINASLVNNQSMKDGSLASANKAPASDATNDDLYPSVDGANYTITVKDGKVTDTEDSWGMWKTFTITSSDGRSFKVDVAIGAYNRDNDVGYTKITTTKL